MASIKELIRDALASGKTVRELEADSGGRVKFQTFQELSQRPPKQFPREVKTVQGMAEALRVTEKVVILAYAKGLGIDVGGESAFASRLPPGVDGLDQEVQDAIVKMIRATLRSRVGRVVPNELENIGWSSAYLGGEDPGVGGNQDGDQRDQFGSR